jgi:transcription antitermination factor NusG
MYLWLDVGNTRPIKGEAKQMLTSLSIDDGMYEASDWWALYTRHQHEKTVAEMLSAKGFEVFLPLYESIRRWKDRSKMLTLPLFPCYVFVRGGLNRRLQVVTTPGVHMILFRGERVAVIPEAEIQAIRKAVEGPFRVEPHPFLKCGERVRVTRGSLEGVEGILVRKKNLYRLVLSVDMMAQSVAVEIDATDVEPATARGLADIFPANQPAGLGRFGETLLHGGRQITVRAS